MATKIRLQRGGRKGYAFFRVVVADSHTPRDGRFIERLGYYNPNTNPSTVVINFERALHWVEVGAQPTDTVRNLLQKEGVYLMKHLKGGVKKGAFDEAAAQAKFDAWKAERAKSVKAVRDKAATLKKDAHAKALEAEKKINEARAKAIAAQKAEAAVAHAEAAVAEAEALTEAAPAPVEETPAKPVAEPVTIEEPVAAEPAATEEPVAAEPVAEEPVAEEPSATEEPTEEEKVPTEE